MVITKIRRIATMVHPLQTSTDPPILTHTAQHPMQQVMQQVTQQASHTASHTASHAASTHQVMQQVIGTSTHLTNSQMPSSCSQKSSKLGAQTQVLLKDHGSFAWSKREMFVCKHSCEIYIFCGYVLTHAHAHDRWAYDSKETTTFNMMTAVKNGRQEWLQDEALESWGNTSGKRKHKQSRAHPSNFENAKVTKLQECWAYCTVWLRDCTAGDSCPVAGEYVEIDPVDHKEVYTEYVADMKARGQGHMKSFAEFNAVLNQCLTDNKVRIASRKKVSTDCPECIWIVAQLHSTKGWKSRKELKERRQKHRLFNAEAQRVVVLNNEEASRHPETKACVTFDIMDQAKLYCPSMPASMGECGSYKLKSKLTGFIHFGGLIVNYFYLALPFVTKGANLSLTEWLHSVQEAPQPLAPTQIWQLDGGSENWSRTIWAFQASLVEDRRANEFINLRKSPGHTHGIADQRFSRIATFILKIIVQTISLMHSMIIRSFHSEGIVVKTFDCPGAIDFDKILKPHFSAELNRGGYGSHPHPTDGLDWTAPTDPNPKTIHCLRVYWEPAAKAALMQYKFYMNDPFWRGHDGKPDTPSSPSPGIPVLASQVNLGGYNSTTWPIAAYSEVKHMKEMKEDIPALCQRHTRIFSQDQCKEWDDLLNNMPSPGPVTANAQGVWHTKVVKFLDGVKLPAINLSLDALPSASNSTARPERPTATSDSLPMLNLTTTSRKRLGLVFENKRGKKKRKQQEQDEQDINHSDSEDPDVDQVECAICSKPTYSVANPILLCDGEGCGKGWHLSCLSRPAQSTAKKAIKEDANWFCSKRCEGLQRHEFESIVDHRAKTLHGTTTVEYLIR